MTATGLTAATVGHDRIVVIVNPDHAWAKLTTPVDRALLASTPFVMREPGSGTRATFEQALGSAPSIAMEAGSTGALLGSVVSGIGPGAISVIAARAAIESGTLVEAKTDLDTARPLRAIWSTRQRLTSPASDLVEIATRPRADLSRRSIAGSAGDVRDYMVGVAGRKHALHVCERQFEYFAAETGPDL